MFRRKRRPKFPDAEKVDLTADDKIDFMLITNQLRPHLRRRLAWRLAWRIVSDVLVFVVLTVAIWGLFTIIQHANSGP